MAASFNGATLLRAWRGPASRAIGSQKTAWLQRSHAPSSVESGAAPRLIRGHRDASTEPRSFERGEVGDLGSVFARRVASTEPRSFERGEAICTPSTVAKASLQRSHAPSSVESVCPHILHIVQRAASTEPRSFERGEPRGGLGYAGAGGASTEPRSFERRERQSGWRRWP